MAQRVTVVAGTVYKLLSLGLLPVCRCLFNIIFSVVCDFRSAELSENIK